MGAHHRGPSQLRGAGEGDIGKTGRVHDGWGSLHPGRDQSSELAPRGVEVHGNPVMESGHPKQQTGMVMAGDGVLPLLWNDARGLQSVELGGDAL